MLLLNFNAIFLRKTILKEDGNLSDLTKFKGYLYWSIDIHSVTLQRLVLFAIVLCLLCE